MAGEVIAPATDRTCTFPSGPVSVVLPFKSAVFPVTTFNEPSTVTSPVVVPPGPVRISSDDAAVVPASSIADASAGRLVVKRTAPLPGPLSMIVTMSPLASV